MGVAWWRPGVKALIVSNHTLIAQSLIASLQRLPSGDTVEASYCEPGTVVDSVRNIGPDVVLIDATTDFAAAVDTLRSLVREVSDVRVIILGIENDEAATYEAILEGAQGYLTVEICVEALARTLQGVMDGELGLPRGMALKVVRLLRQAVRAPIPAPSIKMNGKLTPREQQVFDLVRSGVRSREIADQLSIAEATVYKHIQNILDKLQVHSRTQAIFVSSSSGSMD